MRARSFTHTGYGFQSYSDKDTRTHAERLEKQQDKIRKDLNKLVKFKAFWEPIFHPVKLRHWVLLVPNFDDKKLIPYSKKRVAALKTKNLQFIDADFKVIIHTHHDYPVARALLQNPETACRTVRGAPVTDAQVQGLITSRPQFISNIDDKLPFTMPAATPQQLLDARKDFLNKHLWCANFLDDLRGKYPTLWERIEDLSVATADAIQTEGYFDTSPAGERLVNVRREFEQALQPVAKFATPGQRSRLSWGHVAKWLGVCNLNFRDTTHG